MGLFIYVYVRGCDCVGELCGGVQEVWRGAVPRSVCEGIRAPCHPDDCDSTASGECRVRLDSHLAIP